MRAARQSYECRRLSRGERGAKSDRSDSHSQADAGDAKAQRDTEASLARQAAAEVEAATFEELARYQGPRSEL